VRIIICGGDGTISWVLNELVRYELDVSKCVFGIIPIGTGNDFCRTIDWPSENFDFRLENLLAQMRKWMNAAISKYDIWDVSI
jgi:diacylglycerol kinase (ATP)